MLEITLTDSTEVKLEHSLVSLSKWESKYERPFFSKQEKSEEEIANYLDYMVLERRPPENFADLLTQDDIEKIVDYIDSKQTATWFREDRTPPSREVVTAELIYFWMIQFKIPFSCETWHLNRLMTLIQICSVKQTKPKKMSRQALAEQHRLLNAQRRAELGTSG